MIVYALLGFIRPAIFIFLIPFYLKVFTEAEYGLYNLMVDVGQFAMIIVTFRLNNAMLTYYYNFMDDRAKQRHYLRSLFTCSIVIALFFIVVAYFLGPLIFDLTFKSDDVLFFPYGMTIVAYAALSEVNMNYFTFLKNEKNIVKYAAVVFIQMIAVIAFQLIMIAGLDMGVQGAVLGMLIANIMVTVIIILLEKDLITLSPDMDLVKKSFRFTIILIPYLIIYWLMTRGGRLFLERFTDLETVGIYTLLIAFTGLIVLAVDSVVNGIRPFLFEEFSNQEKGVSEKISLLTNIMINIPLLAIPVIILVGTNVHYITSNENFYTIGKYMTYCSLTIYILVFSRMFYQQLLYAKRSDVITVLSCFTVIVLVIGFYYFIPRYEIWGVLHATLIANVLMALLFYAAGQKYRPARFNFISIIAGPVLIFAILFGLEYLFEFRNLDNQIFGITQFLVLSPLIILLNWKNIVAYKTLFIQKQNPAPSS